MSEHKLLGPTLLDEVARLLEEQGYSGPSIQKKFNVGYTWYSDTILRRVRNPRADKLQEMYEVLTGKPLIRP
jgi:hypothetical protein